MMNITQLNERLSQIIMDLAHGGAIYKDSDIEAVKTLVSEIQEKYKTEEDLGMIMINLFMLGEIIGRRSCGML